MLSTRPTAKSTSFVPGSSSKSLGPVNTATAFLSHSTATSSAVEVMTGFGCCVPMAKKSVPLAKAPKILRPPTCRIKLVSICEYS